MKRGWFVVAWRLVDPTIKRDLVQPWFNTKTDARKYAKSQGIKILNEATK